MSLDIKKINTKVVLIFSGLGFLLGFISGLIAGKDFLSLLISSIVSGIVIGVIIFISNLLIMSYLPELLEDEEDEDIDTGSDSQVDIVMPEEGYTVQREDNYDGSEISGDVNQGESVSNGSDSADGFKEVSMDNLSSIGDSADKFSQIAEDQDSESGEYQAPPSLKGDTNFGKHSTEDMAKAVKTVLKKD